MMPKDFLIQISETKSQVKSLKEAFHALKDSNDELAKVISTTQAKTISRQYYITLVLLIALLLALGYKEAIKIGLLGS